MVFKYLLILSMLFFSACSEQDTPKQAVTKAQVPEKVSVDQEKESAPICANLSVTECLTIIIPAIWDREVEKDCN